MVYRMVYRGVCFVVFVFQETLLSTCWEEDNKNPL